MAFEEKPAPLRQRVQQLAADALSQERPTAWFEPLYQAAQGDTAQVPWAKLAPHPYLQQWLADRPTLGGSALVVGCGLGDDAEALQARGAQVTAFDVAPSAVAWCRQRFPDSGVNYQVADLFELSAAWQGRFDLVFECRNLQALPLTVRAQAVEAVAATVAPQGRLLVITRLRPDDVSDPAGPPWPLSNQELARLENAGLQERQRRVFTEAEIEQALIEYGYD